MDLSSLRRDYHKGKLSRKNLDPDPVKQFDQWFNDATASELSDPSAMSLATSDRSGRVTIRSVLLKRYDENGFVFFTNYESEKSRQIAENPQVALLFPWLNLERQVKITGIAGRVPTTESLKYFLSRPRGSQMGAWVSAQSSVISSRAVLLEKLKEIKNRFADGDISLPEFWGGFRVVPDSIEFWQGQPDRLHDRFRYTKQPSGDWTIDRLAP